MRRSTRRATTTVTSRTAPSTTSRCQNGIVTLSYSKGRGFLPAKPSSAPCQKATWSSPTRQQSSTSSPSCRAGKSTRPLSRSVTSTPIASRRSTQRAAASASRSNSSASALASPGSKSPPLPAIRVTSCARRAAASVIARRCWTSSSAAGLTSARRAFASAGVKYRVAMRVSSRAVSAGQRVRERPAARRAPPPVWARSPAPGIFLWTRTVIWAAALFALFTFVPNRHPLAGRWDDPSLTYDLGAVTDVWARWDSVWFLRIAEHGYGSAKGAAAAFYPLYPATVAVLGRVLFDHYVLAGILVPLAASLVSFLLLHRIADERLGADGARRAVLYLAVFPFALFLQAVYSEALFLLLALAAFAFAERRRFGAAGGVAGRALLQHLAAVALLASPVP